MRFFQILCTRGVTGCISGCKSSCLTNAAQKSQRIARKSYCQWYDNRCYLTWDEVQCIFLNNKCGHRNVLSKRQVWMSIFHIINFKKKNSWTQGPGLVFFYPGLLFLLKVRSCVFFSNFHHSPPPPPKGYKIVSLIIN